MGVLPGWWLGENDHRFPEPYISADRWDIALQRAGFTGASLTSYDGYLNNNIIATPSFNSGEIPKTVNVTLIYSVENPSMATSMVELLTQDGYTVDLCALQGPQKLIPKEQDIVSILDLNKPFFHELQQDEFGRLQRLLSHLQGGDQRLLWVTGAAQVRCKDPRYGMVNGFARVMQNEMELAFATLELENFDEKCLAVVPKVLREFQHRLSEPDTNSTMEWAFSGGQMLISRYHYIRVREELQKSSPSPAQAIKKLEQRRLGLLDTLCWKELPEITRLGDNDVLVEVKAVGLNFKVRNFQPLYQVLR